MIDVSVVEAVEVDEQELSVLQSKLDVVAADGGVVEEDVAVRMPARRCDGIGALRMPCQSRTHADRVHTHPRSRYVPIVFSSSETLPVDVDVDVHDDDGYRFADADWEPSPTTTWSPSPGKDQTQIQPRTRWSPSVPDRYPLVLNPNAPAQVVCNE